MNTCPTCGAQYPPTVRLCTADGTVLQTAPPPDTNIGRVLDGKYRIDTRLGVGGMGAVYRGKHLMLDKTVAVKLIKAEHAATPDFARRFQREARAASSLTHPNIATAYDLGQTEDGMLYIAMEYVDGPSLKDVIRKEGQVPPARIVRILRQVASALSLAHRQNIVHRDLKPQNIMLAADAAGREVAKLVDFGIAKTFDEANTLTATGFAMGTPQYMPPEQATGQPVDGRSDVYSLGIILYEMLIGDVPFNDPSTPAVLVKHMTQAPEHPSTRRPDLVISPALEAVALRCLEKNPAARFQTIDEFADALESATVAESIQDAGAPIVAVGGMAEAMATTFVGPIVARPTSSPASAPHEAVTVPPTSRPRQTPISVPPIPAPSKSVPPKPVPTVEVLPPSNPPQPIGLMSPPASPAGALVPSPPRALVPPVQPPERRGLTPAAVAAAAVVLLLLAAGLVYALAVLRAPRASTSATMAGFVAQPGATEDVRPAPAEPSIAAPMPPAAEAPTVSPPPAGATTPVAEAAAARVPASTPPLNQPRSIAASPAVTGGAPARPASPSAAVPGVATTSPTPASAMAPPAAVTPAPAAQRPATPAVMLRCAGVPDVCATVRSIAESTLADQGVRVVRDPARADVVVDARVALVGQRSDELFGSTVVIGTYSTSLEAEAPRTGDVVAMPPPLTISFDNRARAERLGDHGRLVAVNIAERVLGTGRRRDSQAAIAVSARAQSRAALPREPTRCSKSGLRKTTRSRKPPWPFGKNKKGEARSLALVVSSKSSLTAGEWCPWPRPVP